jgi:Tol biopolymer transport system component
MWSKKLLALVVGLIALAAGIPAAATFPGTNGFIVFQRELPAGDHTQTDLYVVKPDGTGVGRLSNSADVNEFAGRWSPSGKRIVFWRTPAPFGFGEIWIMNAAGQDKRQLTRGFDARDPSWDPTGTRLVFTRNEGADANLWTMRSDGSDLRRLTSGSAFDFEPAWSSDGMRIAFTRGEEQGDPGDIYVLTLSTKTLTRVTRSPAYDHQVSWGPSSGRLLFAREYPRSASVMAADPQGRWVEHLTGGQHIDLAPVASPDGRYVLFSSDRAGGFPDLWRMNRDGSSPQPFLALRYAEGVPDWQAVGQPLRTS